MFALLKEILMSEYEYKLQYPVYTLDNIELFPAGTILSEGKSGELSQLKKGPRTSTVKLFDYGSIKKDILDFISQPPYNAIFSDREQVDSMLEVMGMSELKFPILECLDYFRGEDFYTYRHMLLVFALSILLGQELLKGDLDLMNGAFSSPAHDFGKICVPLEVLKKSDPLTRNERQLLEHHTLAGYVLLKYYNVNELSARIARDHHERNNGSGYPGGIKLKDRLVEIVVVSDIYDALISRRPYRQEVYDNRTAIEEICSKAERGEIGWDVVKALVACNRKSKPHYSDCHVSEDKRGTPPPNNAHGITAEE
jgi:HD-GYP domain-containing protein (c-di-GMP phosphodiesterase class II)